MIITFKCVYYYNMGTYIFYGVIIIVLLGGVHGLSNGAKGCENRGGRPTEYIILYFLYRDTCGDIIALVLRRVRKINNKTKITKLNNYFTHTRVHM